MSRFALYENGNMAGFLIEKESFEGIKMIGETVSEDMELVTGEAPGIVEGIEDVCTEGLVLMATIGKSPMLDRLCAEGRIDLKEITGKCEVYMMKVVETPFTENDKVKRLLVIAGSDKRGTIYGMFGLSKMCGVSPLVYFGDAAPMKKSELILEIEEPTISKEPSVEYRGFFINDEWPAFGNWCTEKFGDVNAKAYRKIFELLLRLNGNYMWPAMWNSSFSEDGPGLLNAELADKLGVIMGLSHHEPMCRSGVEWQRQYKNYSDDNTWSFLSNEAGIRKFWEDGVTRNKDFENVITIGMRGEADSKLMPEDATLEDNIGVIKKAISAQHEIIKDKVNSDLTKVPRMLAIYKEVEDYYFGDEKTEGLKDWDEIKDVIFLLSDDNHGHVRALPTDVDRDHPGGFGMYYHFDYHGGPVSYEWVNCNRLTKTWEQMSLAYEAGVRKMWIVNVGDLKLNEYPLSFFMEMAYDYEAFGESVVAGLGRENDATLEKTATGCDKDNASGLGSRIEGFVRRWIDVQFGEGVSVSAKDDIYKVLVGYTKWNSMRTPETMNEFVYNPVDFTEGDRVIEEVGGLLDMANRLNDELSESALTTYRSMIYYPAAASLNIVLMNVETGLNRELSMRGSVYANHYAKSVQERIAADKKYVADFHAFNGGKWNHMMSSAHTGFRSWDAYNWSYPVVGMVTPIHEAKAVVSFRGSRRLDLGSHWQGTPPLKNDAFKRPDTKEVLLDIDLRGDIDFKYEVVCESKWLSWKESFRGEGRTTLCFMADRDAIPDLSEGAAKVKLTFEDGTVSETALVFEACGDAEAIRNNVDTKAEAGSKAAGAGNIFVENQGIICMDAEHFSDKVDTPDSSFRVMDHLGKRGGAAVKAFPAKDSYCFMESPADVPQLKYNFIASDAGDYKLRFYLPMRNPIVRGGRLAFGYSVNGGDVTSAYGVDEGYFTDHQCKEWCASVLSHEHIVEVTVELKKGLNTLTVYAGDAGVIFERFVLYKAENELPESFLGPRESFRI